MIGEMDQQQVVRLLDRAIKQTRYVHKCDSMMHEARMHMKDAKTELGSLGKKSNNKRMAENHMKKARKKMNSCQGFLLLEDAEKLQEQDDDSEPEALLAVEDDASQEQGEESTEAWRNRHLEDAKKDLDKALHKTMRRKSKVRSPRK